MYIEDARTHQRLPEYQIKHTPPTRPNNKGLIELFVECKDDQVGIALLLAFPAICSPSQEFRIRCHYGKTAFDFAIIPTIDGRMISGLAIFSTNSQKHCTFDRLYENVDGVVRAKSLKFCKLVG